MYTKYNDTLPSYFQAKSFDSIYKNRYTKRKVCN